MLKVSKFSILGVKVFPHSYSSPSPPRTFIWHNIHLCHWHPPSPLESGKNPFLKPSLISHYLFFNFLLSTERKQCFWATRMMRKTGLKYGVFLASFENKFSTPNTCTILRKNASFERGKHKFSFSLHFELQILCHNL